MELAQRELNFDGNWNPFWTTNTATRMEVTLSASRLSSHSFTYIH